MNNLQVFDIANGQWSEAPSMQAVRDNPGTAVINGKLYVFSGRQRLANGTSVSEGQPSMDIYDPATASWANGTAMPRGRRTFVTGTLNGKVQIVGGEFNAGAAAGVFYEIDEFNPITGTWALLGNMPAPRHGAAYATINNQLIIAGGGDVTGSSFKNNLQTMKVE